MTSPNAGFDPLVLERIEEAGINASAPPEQLWVDGWLLRFSPGKAKRARCIQAVADGRRSVSDKLARCLPVFRSHGLWPYVRITPFSRPAGLDDELASLGMEQIDTTCVMVLALDSLGESRAQRHGVAQAGAGVARVREAGGAEFAAWVGAARGSTATEIAAHATRIAGPPVPHRAIVLTNASGDIVAGGQSVNEGDVVGLYDVFTSSVNRGCGHATTICLHLLHEAAARGVRWAYLQVDAANSEAIRVYRKLGFVDAYEYHYRTPPGAPAAPH